MSSDYTPVAVEAYAETPTTQTFRFRLDGAMFDFRPGQYVTVKIAGVDDPRGPQRPFTLSSSPSEADALWITTRMGGSPFKEALKELGAGGDCSGRVNLRGPLGKFTLDRQRPAVMIAGGIGITPFRSMIRWVKDTQAEVPIVLLYSNETPAEIAFREELDDLAEAESWLEVVHTITDPEAAEDWDGRTGRIDDKLIGEAAARLDHPVYYVCGPPGMGEGVHDAVVEDLGVREADLRPESFSGY